MIDYTIGMELLPTIRKIESRIVAIDQNGTGIKPGILQLQDVAIERLEAGQRGIERKIDAYHTDATTWSKRDVLKALAWMCGTIIALGMLATAYMTYHNTYHAGEPILSEHQTTASYSTSDSR